MSTIADIAQRLREDVASGKAQRDQLRSETPQTVRQRTGIAATDQQVRKAQRAAEAQIDAQEAREARDRIETLIRAEFPTAKVVIRRGRKEWLLLEVLPFAPAPAGGKDTEPVGEPGGRS
ncbi:MAG: hypothetical protein JXQ75_03160 [Phycisphaerae bacterium]|nr:hypothetical protein [Phycisphaerae bacterium]